MVGSKGSTIFFNIVRCYKPISTAAFTIRENHKMNNKIVLFALLLIASLGHAQKFILSSDWRDSVITIDGSPIDWDQPFRYFDSKSKLQYSVVNDAKYIYVSIKTNDPKAQMKIMRAGMDVSFDAGGKKKDIGTVHFPIKTNPKLDVNSDPADMEQQVVEKPDVVKMKADWSISSRDIHTQGFKNLPAVITEADSGKYGIEAAISWDRSESMTYELRLPFSAFYKDELTGADTVHPITISIKAYAMDLPLIPSNAAADVTQSAGSGPGGAGAMSNSNVGANGMPNTMGNTGRPQTSSPQPTMAIPKALADMGMPLIVTMKIKLVYR
jgi:hypothetical protein